ncbi:MAG: tRNA (adenosine(37)-N6)-threonylcarbamoyltransferase complex dimerization subunit type 1 TsaB [Candidatus Sericytochromatia bacterium]
MNILAIDASGKLLGLCLRCEGQQSAYLTQPLEHIEYLPEILQRFCSSQALLPSELNALAVIQGPGSYTGLRGSLLLAKSLALLKGVPVMTRLRHEVLLYASRQRQEDVLVSQSVRQQQYYLALGRYHEQAVHYRLAPHLGTAAGLLDIQQQFSCPVLGDWPAEQERPLEYLEVTDLSCPLAEWTEADFCPVDPDSLVPFYVRPAVKPLDKV